MRYKKIAYVLLAIFLISVYMSNSTKVLANNGVGVEYVLNTWENYPKINHSNFDGGWGVRGDVLYTSKNIHWTGFWNKKDEKATDRVMEFKLRLTDSHVDPFGWTFRHREISPGTYAFYAVEISPYYSELTLAKITSWTPSTSDPVHGGPLYHGVISSADGYYTNLTYRNSGYAGALRSCSGKILQRVSIPFSYGTWYDMKIEVKGNRIKVWYNGTLKINYTDEDNPLTYGGYGPYTASQYSAEFKEIYIDGSSFLNVPPTIISINSPVKNSHYWAGTSMTISGTLQEPDGRGTVTVKYAFDDEEETDLVTLDSTGQNQGFSGTIIVPRTLSDGLHTLKIWAKDSENGVSDGVEIPIYVDKAKTPSEIFFSNVTSTSMTINWTTNGNPSGTIYELYDAVSDKLLYSGTNTSYTVTGLSPNTQYQYKIRAKDIYDNYSPYLTGSMYTLANKPLSKGYDNITNNSVRLVWNPNGNPSYTVYYYEVRHKLDDSLVIQGTINGTSVTVTGLTGGHGQYRYFVKAKNMNDEYTDFVELSIPSLNVYQKSNYVKAEWAIEMADEDVLIQTSFEDGEMRPSFRTRNAVQYEEGVPYSEVMDTARREYTRYAYEWVDKSYFEDGNGLKSISMQLKEKYTIYYLLKDGRYRLEHIFYTNGMQSITNEDAYGGFYSHKIENTVSPYKLGNSHNLPDIQSINALGSYPRITGIPNKTNLSLSMRVKSNNKASINAFGDGGWGETIIILPNVIVEDATADSRILKLNSVAGLRVGDYITTDLNPNEVQNVRQIIHVDSRDNTITLNGNLGRDVQAGENLRQRPWRAGLNFPNRNIDNGTGNQWLLLNFNTLVNDYSDYDVAVRGFTFYTRISSYGDTYIDDLKFGYATKAELYRDGIKIYEGFLSDYDDYEAIDKAVPNPISHVNVSNTENIIKITFDVPSDNGTTYNYQLKAVTHNGDTISSEVKSITVTSGIKGYSYVIDSNPDTIPDNIVDVVTPEIKASINPNVKNYVHIKVIDNEGNVSEVFHQEIGIPVLTATPNHEEDYIHLDWKINDSSKEYTYMVYKRSDEEQEYQSIPLKDNIKVLEVYPYISVLKEWTDAYGQGKITTDSISSEELNENPSLIWNYDVIVLGFADSNNRKSLSDNARIEIEKFVEQGRGLLLGHDTVYIDSLRTNYAILASKYLNMEPRSSGNWYNGVAGRNDTNYGGTSTIVISRKGFLTNYPYKIGDVGDRLTVPYSHTSYQYAKGDIWMRYESSNMTDPYNFYLTTWNNVAMIQTGHSIRADNVNREWATEDEQKLIINTLFYLAQISNQTSWDDHTGQDVNGPTKPVITEVKFINNGNAIKIKYTPSEDVGTKYYYYVEGTATNTLVRSNIAEATIKSGLKGYSIVVDQNPDTVPDNEIETTSLEYTVNQRFYQKFYVHVVAVDNVGNISEAAHYECVDTIAPSLIVTGNPEEWTKEDVVLTARAIDNESGIRGIQLPNGEWVYSDTATFTVVENGSYTFIAEDNFGNQTSVTVIVNKIDKTPPSNTRIIINDNALYTNKRNVVLTISAEDNATGVVAMRFKTENGPWTEWMPYATTIDYTMDAGFTHQGTNRVYVQFKDGVGNIGGDAFDSIIYDSIAPTGEIVYSKVTANSRNIILTIHAYDINPANADVISGLNSVRFRELQNGVVKQDWTSWEQYNPIRHWILSDGDGDKVVEMEIKDNAGNVSKVTKTIKLDTLFIKETLFTDIVNPPLDNPELPTSEVIKVKKGYEFTFIVRTSGNPDFATYMFNGETGMMEKITDNLFRKTLKVNINDDSINNEIVPIYITVARMDGTQKNTTLKVHIVGSAYDDYNINLTN